MAVKYYKLKDGTNLCYKDTGEGRPIVFVHGWGEHKEQWDAYETAISEAGYRYIMMDQRATKDTGASMTRPVHIDLLVDDLQDLITGLGLKDVTLVGHSMGVQIVLKYVGKFGNDLLHSIVLNDCPPRQCTADDGWEYAIWDNTFTVEQAYADSDWMLRDMMDYLRNWIKGSNPDIAKAEDPEAAVEEWAQKYYDGFWPDEQKELYRSLAEVDNRENVEKITVPVAYFYPDPGAICKRDLWTWYRDHVHAPFRAQGFDSKDHFFCISDRQAETIEALKKFLQEV